MNLSPFQYRRGLIASCTEANIAVEAYSPLGTGRHLSRETVRLISERIGQSPAQVLLRWCIQHGFVVITKSTHRERIQENAAIFDFTLSEGEMLALDREDETGGTDRAVEHKWW
jgi:2,5-diketo-D-gluconate reductase A